MTLGHEKSHVGLEVKVFPLLLEDKIIIYMLACWPLLFLLEASSLSKLTDQKPQLHTDMTTGTAEKHGFEITSS